METNHFLGIDISKRYFNFCLLDEQGVVLTQNEVENRKKAIGMMFSALKKAFGISCRNVIVCMEHTGVYCNLLLDYLHRHQFKTCVEPALQIKQSLGMTRGKNDKVDAERIAKYALKNRLELRFWKPEREVIQKIRFLLSVRERLIKSKIQLQGPLMDQVSFIEKKYRTQLGANYQASLKAISRDITKVEKEIKELIKLDQGISNMMKFAKSVPGVGSITAINMIISSGEFKRIENPRRFACYSGVAPFEHRSGKSFRGKTRVSKMGNQTMKRLLHLAAMAAVKSMSDIAEYYRRKLKQGKNKMNAINAVRNKLISRVYSCVINQRMYQKIYLNPLA